MRSHIVSFSTPRLQILPLSHSYKKKNLTKPFTSSGRVSSDIRVFWPSDRRCHICLNWTHFYFLYFSRPILLSLFVAWILWTWLLRMRIGKLWLLLINDKRWKISWLKLWQEASGQPSLLESEKFDVEDQGGVWRNRAGMAAGSVGVVGCTGKCSPFADRHLGHTLIPPRDYLALADSELERLSAITRRIELSAVGQRTGVMHDNGLAVSRIGRTISLLDCFDVHAHDVCFYQLLKPEMLEWTDYSLGKLQPACYLFFFVSICL